MNDLQKNIIVWASLRVNYLHKFRRYEDSYAVSQEFNDWTTYLNIHTKASETLILKVPTFHQGNRSS